jgi:ubiquinone/menaquinone biosynthesis C-methylase UbiE
LARDGPNALTPLIRAESDFEHRVGGNTFRVDDPFSTKRAQAAYDVAADDYMAAFGEDLARLPLDRRMLDEALKTANDGAMLDLGCGTGSAGSYLSFHGGRVVGLDLSLGMLGSCRSACGFPVCQGDMRHLPFGDGAFAAVVAYYSIHSVRRVEVGAVLAESARVLKSQGTLLLSTHLGEGEVYVDEFLGHRIATTGGTLYSSQEIADSVASAGFFVEKTEFRGPLEHEHQSQRIYLLAKRGG